MTTSPSFDGKYVHIPPTWSWPKPVQPGGPPVLIGGAPGPKLFAHVAEYADGWIPIGGAGIRAALDDLHAACDAAGRDSRRCRSCRSARSPTRASSTTTNRSESTEVVLRLPSGDAERVLPILDEYAPLVGI